MQSLADRLLAAALLPSSPLSLAAVIARELGVSSVAEVEAAIGELPEEIAAAARVALAEACDAIVEEQIRRSPAVEFSSEGFAPPPLLPSPLPGCTAEEVDTGGAMFDQDAGVERSSDPAAIENLAAALAILAKDPELGSDAWGALRDEARELGDRLDDLSRLEALELAAESAGETVTSLCALLDTKTRIERAREIASRSVDAALSPSATARVRQALSRVRR